MKELEIIKLHKELYEYLMDIHRLDRDKTFRFRVRRMNNLKRLEKGYCFNGNDNYLETSFWDYKDNLHQTSVIRLVYFFKNKKWVCELIGRDNRERESYFRAMASKLGFYNDDIRMPIWKKDLDNSQGFLYGIEQFVKSEKDSIDNYLISNKNDKIVKFIDATVFEKDKDRVENVRDNRNNGLIIKENTLEENDVNIQFPFALSSLDVKDFQGINSLTIGIGDDAVIPINTQWVFLTGENAFGKTSILRAIAIGLAGDETGEFLREEYKYKPTPNIEVIGYKNGKYYSTSKEDNEEIEDFEKIVAYGVSRFSTAEAQKKESKRTTSLFSEKAVLINIEDKLIRNPRRSDDISNKLMSIIPNLAKIEKVENANGDIEILIKEKDKQGNIYKDGNGNEISVKLEDLAAGFRSIFMMMGDMIIRLSNDLEKSIDDISGVVLIDEIDAHLHPKYQYELPKLLSDAFPKVQFIVTTHSPIPLLGLPEKNKQGKKINSVVFKVNRTVEEGIIVDRLDDDIDIRRLSANALLTSDIFGFKDIFARGSTPDTIIPFNQYEDVAKSEKLALLKQKISNLELKPQ